MVLSVPLGLLFMCYCSIATSIINLIINTYYTGKLINVGFGIQMRDLSKTLVSSLLMFAIVFLVTLLVDNNIMKLLLGFFSGVCVYLGVVLVFRFKELSYIKSIIQR